MSIHDQTIYLKKDRMQRIAVTTTGAATALNSNILGNGWVRVQAKTANVQCYFGSGLDTVTLDEASTTANMGFTIAAGTWQDYYLTNETHFVWDADAAGFVELLKLDRRVSK